MCEPLVMTLAEFRKDKGLSQEEVANALGLKSKGHISDIERADSGRSPSLELALRIEKWSGGKVPASSICPLAAELMPARRRRAPEQA